MIRFILGLLFLFSAIVFLEEETVKSFYIALFQGIFGMILTSWALNKPDKSLKKLLEIE